ncbi:MAG TPA: hypothetical protein ENK57_23935 [Polyangiaceae bacterium]|nr:hypothetical protein [Polyangiaceae bacterium]
MTRGSHLISRAALLSTLLLVSDAVASSPAAGASNGAPPPTAIERADIALGGIEVRSIRVQRWLGEARAEKNLPRARCLDRLLSQAHAVERRARIEMRRVSSAAERGAEAAAGRSLTRLDLLGERSRSIAEEAYWCGKKRSRRPKAPTGYWVRVIRPRLPNQSVRPSSDAAAWR